MGNEQTIEMRDKRNLLKPFFLLLLLRYYIIERFLTRSLFFPAFLFYKLYKTTHHIKIVCFKKTKNNDVTATILVVTTEQSL